MKLIVALYVQSLPKIYKCGYHRTDTIVIEDSHE